MTTPHAYPLTEIDQIFDRAVEEGRIKEGTARNLKYNVRKVIEMMIPNLPPTTKPYQDVLLCYRKPKVFFDVIEKQTRDLAQYKLMISSLLSMSIHDKAINDDLDQLVGIYRNELNRVSKLINRENIKKADNGVIMPWSNFIELRTKCRYEGDLNEYLLMCLYTMIPPMRDNFGHVILVDDSDHPPKSEPNMYFTKEGRLLITNYKTVKSYGAVDIILPKKLRKIINQSIEMRPRTHLITRLTNPNETYANLSDLFGKYFNFTINDIRHSFETYHGVHHDNFSERERELIYHIMGHNATMGNLYSRHGSDPSTDWTTEEVDPESSDIEKIFIKIGGKH